MKKKQKLKGGLERLSAAMQLCAWYHITVVSKSVRVPATQSFFWSLKGVASCSHGGVRSNGRQRGIRCAGPATSQLC